MQYRSLQEVSEMEMIAKLKLTIPNVFRETDGNVMYHDV